MSDDDKNVPFVSLGVVFALMLGSAPFLFLMAVLPCGTARETCSEVFVAIVFSAVGGWYLSYIPYLWNKRKSKRNQPNNDVHRMERTQRTFYQA